MIIQLHEEKKKNLIELSRKVAISSCRAYNEALYRAVERIANYIHLKINELFEKDRDFYRRGGGGFNTIFLSLIFIEMKFYSLRSFGVIKKRTIIIFYPLFFFFFSLIFLCLDSFPLSRFRDFQSKTVASWK